MPISFHLGLAAALLSPDTFTACRKTGIGPDNLAQTTLVPAMRRPISTSGCGSENMVY